MESTVRYFHNANLSNDYNNQSGNEDIYVVIDRVTPPYDGYSDDDRCDRACICTLILLFLIIMTLLALLWWIETYGYTNGYARKTATGQIY